MQKVTIITGPQGCGKTSKAKDLVAGKVPVWLEVAPTEFKELTGNRFESAIWPRYQDAEVFIFDGVGPADVNELKQLIHSETIRFRRPYAPKAENFPRPELIIISNCLDADVFGDAEHIHRVLFLDVPTDDEGEGDDRFLWTISAALGLQNPSSDDLSFIASVIDGGKTDHTERARTLCSYFDKPGKEIEIYNLFETRFIDSLHPTNPDCLEIQILKEVGAFTPGTLNDCEDFGFVIEVLRAKRLDSVAAKAKVLIAYFSCPEKGYSLEAIIGKASLQ